MSKMITAQKSSFPRKAHLYVLGCKVNQAEIDSVSNFLERQGFEIDLNSESPDLVFINTCCVTDSAAGKSRRMVKRIYQKYPEAKMLVAGCLAEIDPSMIKMVNPKALVLGTHAKDHFPDVFLGDMANISLLNSTPASSCKEFSDVWKTVKSSRSRAFLKVQDGCSHRCSYCVVPIARGPSRSLSLQKAIVSAQTLADTGYSEIAITGIHLGAYGRDLTPKLALEDLIAELLTNTYNCRFRLSSIEPQELSTSLIHLISETPRICRHFHIPVQSGDDEILKKMNRPYNTELVLRLTEKILELIPDSCIGMDVMVGFPGETDSSFEKTKEFIKKSKCNYLHVFPFSPRKGTMAYKFSDRVSPEVARTRVQKLRSLSMELKSAFINKLVGSRLEAVIESSTETPESWGKCLTDNYIMIKIQGVDNESEKKIVTVKIDKNSNRGVYGSICNAK